MASIQEHLDKIKNAVFGKDVRQSIHDGLHEINQETESTSKKQEKLERTFNDLIINAGNSNAEVAAARNGFETLGKRLDGVDSQLDTIAHDGFKWRELDNGYITIIMDDVRADVKTVSDICMEYNIPLCCSAIAGTSRQRLSDLKYVQDGYGGEILSHGYNSTFLNPLTNTGADYKKEIIDSKEELYNQGLVVYGMKKPGNSLYTGYEEMVKENYLYGTNLFGNEATYGNDCDPYAINAIYIGSQSNEQLKTLMDNAKTNKKWLLFYGHTIDGSETGVDETKLRYIGQYAKDIGLKPTTLKDFYYKFGENNFNAKDKFLNNTINSLAKIKAINTSKHYLVLQANNDIVISNTGTIDPIIFSKAAGNGVYFNSNTGEIQMRKSGLYKISVEYNLTTANGANDYSGQIGIYVTGSGIDNLHGKYNLDTYGKFRTYSSSYIINKNYDDILIPKIFKNIPIDIIVGKFSRVIVEEI